jgi:DNA-directed RNA polymerase subunit RPC12/RpoP
MNGSLREVIVQAQREGEYACMRCAYDLGRVPLSDELAITCPECGFEMAFDVRVRLRPLDPGADVVVRGRLHRIEVVLMIVVIGLVATAIGIGIIILAIVGR